MPLAQIGPYRIVRTLGKGGMGVVYEAIQEPLGRRVALKLLLPEYAQKREVLSRFFNEARAVNLIEHPSIVQISDHGQAPDGTAFLVMEFLRGETLSARIGRFRTTGDSVPLLQAIHIAAQIADALAAAHDNAVIHRDLKPANVMLVPDPAVSGGERVKVLDFGIAKLAEANSSNTETNAVMGTLQYMSPEQCRGAKGVNEKTDVYALGVMLYQMLAGRLPFLAKNPVEYITQHAFAEPPPLRDFAKAAPPELLELVHRLLTKDKSQRPSMRQAGSELFGWLSRLSGGGSIVAPPTHRPDETNNRVVVMEAPPTTMGGSLEQLPQSAPSLRRRTLLVAVAGLFLGVCILGLSSRRFLGPSEPRAGANAAPGSPLAPALPPAKLQRPRLLPQNPWPLHRP